MLSYDSLIEQAGARLMPHTKIRGILREYLQILTLKEIYRAQGARAGLYFTGGTYLRLVHGIKRFSEDLDFNAAGITKKDFEKSLDNAAVELKRSGMNVKTAFDHWGNIYAARLIFPDIERLYGTMSKYSRKEGMVIKVEANIPRWRIRHEARMVSGFGELYPCACTGVDALFADKIEAFSKKDMPRHLYDIIFLLSNNSPVDKVVLKALGLKEHPLDIILHRLESLSDRELKKWAEALRPFLFDEAEAELIAKARYNVPSLVEKYRRACEYCPIPPSDAPE